jgi:hypothetical protein
MNTTRMDIQAHVRSSLRSVTVDDHADLSEKPKPDKGQKAADTGLSHATGCAMSHSTGQADGQPPIHSTPTEPCHVAHLFVECRCRNRHREVQWSAQSHTATAEPRVQARPGASAAHPKVQIPQPLCRGHLTYPEFWHLDDETHRHVDSGALPVVHGDEVGGQLVESCVESSRDVEETHWRVTTPEPPVAQCTDLSKPTSARTK